MQRSRRASARGGRHLAWHLASLSLLYTSLLVGCGDPPAQRPNLALITLEPIPTHRLDCYGGLPELGAGICAVADEGSRYVWAFSTSPATAPAVASMLTSQHPSGHGVWGSPATFLHRRGETLPELLRRAGYSTAAFVSDPALNRSRNFYQGFQLYRDRGGTGPDGETFDDAAIAWVEDAEPPWFVWIHLAEPSDGSGPLPVRSDDIDAAIRRLDRRVSRLVAVLDSRPDLPAILVAGLVGVAAAESQLDVPALRIPLIWRPTRAVGGPGVGRRIVQPVSGIDVAPTLASAAGLRAPAGFEGAPLPQVDRGGEIGANGRRPVLAETRDLLAIAIGDDFAWRPRLAPVSSLLDRARLDPSGTSTAFSEPASAAGSTTLSLALDRFATEASANSTLSQKTVGNGDE